jgi:hypothetical protein
MLPYPKLFSCLAKVIAKSYFTHGNAALDAACMDICRCGARFWGFSKLSTSFWIEVWWAHPRTTCRQYADIGTILTTMNSAARLMTSHHDIRHQIDNYELCRQADDVTP